MTTVSFKKINNVIRVSAHDHAYGNEKVCAAVSEMMYALEAWLLNHPSATKKHSGDFRSGEAYVEFVALNPDIYVILDFIITGLASVEYSYKGYLSLDVDESVEKLIWDKESEYDMLG